MRRGLLISLTVIALGLTAGCGGGGYGGGGTPPPPQANALNGQYAFVLTGFDSTANPMGMAGSFKADGFGHITAGEVDVNDNGVLSSSSSVAGTYAFDANGGGALVTVTLTNSVGTPPLPNPLAFGIALQASGAFGDIMSLDANNFIAAGTVQLQTSAVFSLSSLAADYIITLDGRNSANPTSVLGRFTLGASGATTNVTFDRSVAGVGTAGPTTGASAVVTFAAAGPDTNGRGTFSLALNDALINTTQTFAYYAITANRFVAVETDATGTMIADGSKQATLSSFTATTVNTTGSVLGVAGVDTAVPNEIAAVGQLQVSGSNTGTLLFDSNDNGAIVGPTNLANLPVTFDPASGRGTIAVANGSSNGLFDSATFYLTASGTGFILDTVTGATNRAMAGTLSAQSGSPFTVSTLSGQMIARSRGSSVNDALSLVGLIAPTSNSVYTFVLDQRFPPTPITTQVDVSIPGVSLLTLDSNTGRGTFSIPTGGTPATEVFYEIGANQMDFIDVSPVSSGNNGASSLFFVNAQ
jgi:hypothetical protein